MTRLKFWLLTSVVLALPAVGARAEAPVAGHAPTAASEDHVRSAGHTAPTATEPHGEADAAASPDQPSLAETPPAEASTDPHAGAGAEPAPDMTVDADQVNAAWSAGPEDLVNPEPSATTPGGEPHAAAPVAGEGASAHEGAASIEASEQRTIDVHPVDTAPSNAPPGLPVADGHGDAPHDGGHAEGAADGHGAADAGATDHGGDAGAHDAAQWPTTRSPMPFEIVRSIEFLQDQVARGNGQAIRVQAGLLRRFAPVLMAAPPETWHDPRNVRAAAMFVLSGGPPAVLRGILGGTVVHDHDRTLLEGALAYVENRTAQAKEKLGHLDLRDTEPLLAAQLSLVLGQIDQNDDPKSAMTHLDRARLLAPGGLIEEAALRLEVLIAEKVGDTGKADDLARQYFDRYARSAYAANFRARFAAVYAGRPQGTEKDVVAKMMDLTAGLTREEQLSLFLAVSRRALVMGNLQLSGETAAQALTYDVASPEDRQRALLYSVASTLTSRSFADASATLNAIDPALLHPADLQLRSAAYSILDEMRRPAELAVNDDGRGSAISSKIASDPVASRAQQLLNEVSNDLKAASQ
ncbi:hypothetical protein NPA31_001875 [Aurantimonas sp. MSK8Z-1]|uniref:hypothetical protein n=1 Tax=Mangrovibrevibacter kandeliae TaxID=2968473 RepID=UPI002118B81C|nr:hypothetical protein [Aurantimonas sp. MSK8Z-1]MCW4113710.1 hypothetical protein [Aurantimonas sp. MSK8Z-1]